MFSLIGDLNESVFLSLPLQDLDPETRVLVGTGLVFDEQLNDFHCLWDDR